MQALRSILIYQDAGTFEQSALAIKGQLQRMFDQTAEIRMVDSHFLRTAAWERGTYALVMGGGMCSTWEQMLQEEGMRKIYNYVFKGGRYLGICAGGYFGAAYSFFSLLGRPPLIKARPLRFYLGRALGPINATENHLSPQAALAVKVELVQQNSLKEGFCYYQGGPIFDILESSYLTRVLMKYAAPFRGAAAISNIVGDGKAVMCGLHPEFFWDKTQCIGGALPEFCYLTNLLSENEDFRQQIWQTLLQELL